MGIGCPSADPFSIVGLLGLCCFRAAVQDHPELKKGEELYWLHHAGWLTSITFGQYVAGRQRWAIGCEWAMWWESTLPEVITVRGERVLPEDSDDHFPSEGQSQVVVPSTNLLPS